MNIYVGNLSYDTTEDDLRTAFAAFGEVSSVSIIKDRISGESRGFAFVEMPTKSEGIDALSGLNGTELKGRSLNISEARPRQERGSGGGGGGGHRGGGGGQRGGGGGNRGGFRGGY